MTIRRLLPTETGHIEAALLRTARWREIEPTVGLEELCRLVPKLSAYHEGFGREGDLGLVAEEEGAVLGVAWFRLFEESRAGFGFIDPRTPELGIAVWPLARRHGVGGRLLDELILAAQSMGFGALSLAVGDENAVAQKLYLSRGFQTVVQEGRSIKMRLVLIR